MLLLFNANFSFVCCETLVPVSLQGKCVFRFELEDDFHKPFLYYRYENFYQVCFSSSLEIGFFNIKIVLLKNHRRYLKSVSFSQLRGDDVNDYDELVRFCDA